SNNLAMVVIDRLLGGPGTISQSLLQRPLSRLEVSLLLRFLERIARSLLSVITGEGEGQSVQVQNLWTSEEQIGILTDKVSFYNLCYDFQLGQESGYLWIALRADALKGLEQQFQHRQVSPNHLKESHPVMSLPATMQVILASGRITMKELRQLQVGDVILLDGFKGEPARLVWNGRTLCMVRPGTRNGHLAAQVLPPKTQQRGEVK
ncbi:MAG: FliM/FliN family flagellar motor switch protein, partial [Armatimonadetes bacterium]|nr:FliM/FliN family flagellar motor switch protein [Armatimonadota bacterium]